MWHFTLCPKSPWQNTHAESTMTTILGRMSAYPGRPQMGLGHEGLQAGLESAHHGIR